MKKIGVLSLVLVLCLAALAAGYAKWSDSVSISGTVNTGKVCVGIRDLETNDPGPHGQPGNEQSYFTGSLDPAIDPTVLPTIREIRLDKNVASIDSVNIGEPKCVKGEVEYYGEIEETIDNVYPYYAPSTSIALANCGTIPVKVDTFNLAFDDPDNVGCHMVIYKWVITENGIVKGQGNDLNSLMAFLCGNEHYQLEPCCTVQLDLSMYFDQETPQCKSLAFTIDITFSQWNEVP